MLSRTIAVITVRLLVSSAVALSTLAPLDAQRTIDELGGQYSRLRPEQKALVDRWTREVGKIAGTRPDPARSYDQLPLSARTTFEAVTHALLRSTLTDAKGKSLGRAIDLVDIVERVAGKVDGVRGDHQFRVYVYLKSDALKKLHAAREFKREHDNTVYHIGYPMNFRQQGGPPSIQFSVARTGQRADIDVDYRSSAKLKALFDGHLTAANSDVRAGGNPSTHNRRWQDLGNWWDRLLAGVFGNDLSRADASGTASDGSPIVPPVSTAWERAARGDVHEAIESYARQWLVAGEPMHTLRAISIKAYPCVAEYRDGSRPDSRLALYRILAQMKRINGQVGKISDLSAAIEPVDYPLPGARPVDHAYSQLFRLQQVPDDVAWALDCRLRYRLDMAEHVPQPSHNLGGIHVATFRFKKRSDPNEFRLQFWQKQSGEWKLVSFDIKHSLEPPPADIVARTARKELTPPSPSKPAVNAGSADQVQAAAVRLLDTWLKDKNAAAAIESFMPEAYACDAFDEGSVPDDARAGPLGRDRLVKALTAVAASMGKGERLEALIESPEAGHHQMEPVAHPRAGAFLLAHISDELLAMRTCGDERIALRQNGAGTFSRDAFVTAFQSAQTDGEHAAAVLLFWTKSSGEWRVVSFAIDEH